MTQVPELTYEQRLQTYVSGLKEYIRDKLQMHSITTLEKARRNVKIIEKKIKKPALKNFKGYLKQMPPKATDRRNSKYIPPHLRAETLIGLEA